MLLHRRRLSVAVFLSSLAQRADAAGNTYSTENSKLTLLIGALCLIILLLYLFDYLIRLGHGYVQHRRACKIAAVLETEGHDFAGFLSVIGLNGCRFQPLNKTVEVKLLNLLSGRVFYDYDVKIADKAYPVFVDGFHGFFAPLFFYDEISRPELKEILKLSKIKPYLVPRIGHETTREAYHHDILRRREKIKELKAAHLRRDPTGAGLHHSPSHDVMQA